MLPLGSFVLLSQLHPAWDWDQNLRATDFPSSGGVECVSGWGNLGVPPVPQACPSEKWAALGTQLPALLGCLLGGTEHCPLPSSAVLGLSPSRASRKQPGTEKDQRKNSCGALGCGALTAGQLVAVRCSSSIRKYREGNVMRGGNTPFAFIQGSQGGSSVLFLPYFCFCACQ